MLTITQPNLFIASRIFKNSFQELYIHFIMANAQKIIESAAIQLGPRNTEEGISLIWCWVIGKRELLTPSISQKSGLLLKRPLQLLCAWVYCYKTSNQREKRVHRIFSRNIQPEQVLSTSHHLVKCMTDAHPNQIARSPQLTDGWQVHTGLRAACHPNTQRQLSLIGFQKGSTYCFRDEPSRAAN